ncbi:MAG: hypothetical protein JWM34_224 [Ilumatobacteraceae bacterium]|nr:hypothetical protein [Ilumatobacteraceae bacterium]
MSSTVASSNTTSLRIGSIQRARSRWRVVVNAGTHADGRRRQVARSADTEDEARALLAAMVAEFGLTAERPRPEGREPGPRSFAVPLLLAGGPLGLLPRRSLQSVADAVGISIEAARAAYHSGLTSFEADRWAVACKVHPFEVWGWPWVELAAAV